MSFFGGETEADQRDYGFAFAALKSSMYLALVQARTGRLSLTDAMEHSTMVRDGLSIVPERYLPAPGRAAIEESLAMIERMAAANFESYEQ